MRAAAEQPAPSEQEPRIVICGAGIVGASSAFYLAERGLGGRCTLVDKCGVAAAASGRAAGFLARDWNDGSPVGPLAQLSYGLHRELAKRFGEEQVGYRGLRTWYGDTGPGMGEGDEATPLAAPTWLPAQSWPGRTQLAGLPETTAQVHPQLLCEQLVAAAKEGGVHVRQGAVEGLGFDDGGRCVAVTVDGEDLPCDVVILALGPWMDKAREWLPPKALPQVFGLRRTSVVVRAELPAEACLFHLGGEFSYIPRPDGTLYLSGITEDPGDCPLPEDASGVAPNEQGASTIEHLSARLCPKTLAGEVLHRQSCFMPVVGNGLPLIGPAPGCAGGSVLLGTGHGPWGILNGPATGLLLAEMVADGHASSLSPYDLAAFDPAACS